MEPWQGTASLCGARLGLAGLGKKTTECVTGCRNRRWDLIETRRGVDWRGVARQGGAWQGNR